MNIENYDKIVNVLGYANLIIDIIVSCATGFLLYFGYKTGSKAYKQYKNQTKILANNRLRDIEDSLYNDHARNPSLDFIYIWPNIQNYETAISISNHIQDTVEKSIKHSILNDDSISYDARIDEASKFDINRLNLNFISVKTLFCTIWNNAYTDFRDYKYINYMKTLLGAASRGLYLLHDAFMCYKNSEINEEIYKRWCGYYYDFAHSPYFLMAIYEGYVFSYFDTEFALEIKNKFWTRNDIKTVIEFFFQEMASKNWPNEGGEGEKQDPCVDEATKSSA